MHLNIDNTAEFLKLHMIKPSFQRIKIFDFLNHSVSHPSVDDIYQALISEIPTLSKTTIYNTLNIFVENKIVDAITIDNGEMRYDINDEGHGHFKCLVCDKIYDIDLEFDMENQPGLEGFKIDTRKLYFKGTCKFCNEAGSKDPMSKSFELKEAI